MTDDSIRGGEVGHSDNVVIGSRDRSKDPLIFSVGGSEKPIEVIRFCHDGEVMVYGRPVANDAELVQAMKTWALTVSTWMLSPPRFPLPEGEARKITADDIRHVVSGWSPAERSKLMSMIRWPGSRSGRITRIDFGNTWLFRRGMAKVVLDQGDPAYVDERALMGLVIESTKDGDQRRSEASFDEIQELLVGREVVVDDHPTLDGVRHAVWLKGGDSVSPG